MTTVHDVAALILRETGTVTVMKLQKLAYYCQAWSLAALDRALFAERFEAWSNGPVSPDLYRAHRGQYDVSSWAQGNPDSIDPAHRQLIKLVLSQYDKFDAHQLSQMTHGEPPWREARRGLSDTAPSKNVISHESMRDHYKSRLPAK